MGFWTIILAIFVGLAAFVVIFVIYALCSPEPTKEQLEQLNKKLARQNTATSPPKREDILIKYFPIFFH